MKISSRISARCFVLMFLSGCVSSPTYDYEALMEPDPNLPSYESVEIMGTLALQAMGRYAPEYRADYASMTKFEATYFMVDQIFKLPTEELLADPGAVKIALFALAHQWGHAQSRLDELERYDQLLEYRYDEIVAKRKRLAISNVFAGISAGAYGVANANATTDAEAYSNEMGAARANQMTQQNVLMDGVLDTDGKTYEEIRLEIAQQKKKLQGYSNVLETYRDWLLEPLRDELNQSSPEAVAILEANAKTT